MSRVSAPALGILLGRFTRCNQGLVQAGEQVEHRIHAGDLEDAQQRRLGCHQEQLPARLLQPLVRTDQDVEPGRVAELSAAQVDDQPRGARADGGHDGLAQVRRVRRVHLDGGPHHGHAVHLRELIRLLGHAKSPPRSGSYWKDKPEKLP
jgi:hypothetical protein